MSKPPVSPSSGAGGIKATRLSYFWAKWFPQEIHSASDQWIRPAGNHSLQPISTNPGINRSWCCSLGIPVYHGIPWSTCIYTTTFTQRHPHAPCWASNALGSFFKVRYELWRGKARKNANNTVVLPNTKRVDSSELRTETNKTGFLNSDVILIWGWATKLSYHRIGELRIHSDLLIHTQRDLADILFEG